MLAEQGADKLTMDGLAERAGLGKGTVFRRFGTRAGIFQALLDDDEREFQEQVLSGPPPLGPGAPPLDRLIAYGRARIGFLIGHREIARAALDGRERVPAGSADAHVAGAHPVPARASCASAPPTWTCWPPSSPRPWTARCCSTCRPPTLTEAARAGLRTPRPGLGGPGPARLPPMTKLRSAGRGHTPVNGGEGNGLRPPRRVGALSEERVD